MKNLFVLQYILKDHLRQEFAGISEQLKSKFGIKIPFQLALVLSILSQCMLLLFFSFIFDAVTNSVIKYLIIFVVLFFNLMLPGTTARQHISRVSNNPLNDLLWQSSISRTKLLNYILVSELIIFWVHEFAFQIIAFYVLFLISPNIFVAIFLTLFWLLLVSSLYYFKMKKMLLLSWGMKSSSSKIDEYFYLLRFTASMLFIYLISRYLIAPIVNKPITQATLNSGLVKTLKQFSENSREVLENKFKYTLSFASELIYSPLFQLICIFVLITYALLFIYINFWKVYRTIEFKENTKIKLKRSQGFLFKYYRKVARLLYKKNPWIERDLVILERTLSNSNISQRSFLFLPPAISPIIAFSLFLFHSINSYSSFIVCIWFVSWVVVSQTIWLWLMNFPILHPSSELRQIDLTNLSPKYSINEYMDSKKSLITILLLPTYFLLIIVLIIGMSILQGSMFEFTIGILGSIILFNVNVFVSTFWLKLCSRFDFSNMYMIRMDSYEVKVIQYFFTFPKRLISGALGIVFFAALFLKIDSSFELSLLTDTFFGIVAVGLLCWYFMKTKSQKVLNNEK